MHRSLIRKIINDGNTIEMEHLTDVLIDAIDYIEVVDCDEYKKIEYKLYKMVYGGHLSEETAKEWVASMENKDGTKGEHWTMEQTSQFAGRHDKNDWYAVLNMMWSDYYNEKFDTNTYVQLANDWINDPDVGECKTLK